MNNVTLTGRVTKEIELRQTPNGHSTCTFSIAVDGGRSKDGVRHTDFPNIIAWNKTAEICAQYLHKGDMVGITGSIQTSTYEKNGTKIYDTKVLAIKIDFLTPKSQAGQNNDPVPVGEPTQDGFQQVEDSELPF